MFIVDKLSRVPIYEQIIEQTEFMILQDILKQGEILPSVRQLSQEISVNPNTLQKAYSELERRGICYTVPGMGRRISDDAKVKACQSRSVHLDEIARLADDLAAAKIPLCSTVEPILEAYKKHFLLDTAGAEKIVDTINKTECAEGGICRD